MLTRFALAVLVVAAVLCGLGRTERTGAEPPKPDAKPPQANEEIVRIEADLTRAISQGDTEGCGPVSLLNLLKLGPEPYQKAYTKLSQGDDALALEAARRGNAAPRPGLAARCGTATRPGSTTRT